MQDSAVDKEIRDNTEHMKKVAVLRSNPKDAGYAKVLKILAREYKLDCYIWDRQSDFAPVLEHENITYRKCKVRAGFHDMRTLLKLPLFEIWLFLKLLFTQCDVVHAIDLDTGLAGFCIARLKGKYFVYHCLDPYYSALPPHWPGALSVIAKKIENAVISHSDLFIISDILRMPQHQGAVPKKVLELPNVPLLEISQHGEKKEGKLVVGYIGSLVEGRNLKTIIEGVGALADKGVILIIGGFGPLNARMKQLSGRYANVSYCGMVPYRQLLEMESGFDVFLHIIDKRDEGQKWGSPNKLFESMAFGRPIITGEGTLTAERVAAIGNGVAVRYDSKEELQKAILFFKDHPEVVAEMGEKGRKAFETNWSPEEIGNRLLKAYEELAN